jgi:hypothetical protein
MTVVVCALALLGRSPESMAPFRFLEHAPGGTSQNVEAFVVHTPDTIYFITSSSVFREAMKHQTCSDLDDIRKIASIIVHEEWHLLHGADERGAYQAQLTALAMLGANSPMISSVRQSMAVAVRNQARARRTPELVIARDAVP